MNLKKAIWMGVLVYAISFAFGITTAVLLGIDFSTAAEVPNSVWYYGIVFTAIMMALFTWWYFKDENINANYREGAYFGLIAIAVGFVFDAVIIIPSIVFTDAPQDILAYYTNPLFWLTLVILVATATLVGWWRSK